jgi:hypothetical protein
MRFSSHHHTHHLRQDLTGETLAIDAMPVSQGLPAQMNELQSAAKQ